MKYKVNSLVTRDFSDLTAATDNIYESVAIISKRARQVALYLKEDLDRKLADFINDDLEELDEEEKLEEQEQAAITKLYEQLPKPVTMAIEEFLENKLMYRYPDEELQKEV
jgi:DNA-directed RNA polymerase subunit K/omega